jgi:hypothetical protein
MVDTVFQGINILKLNRLLIVSINITQQNHLLIKFDVKTIGKLLFLICAMSFAVSKTNAQISISISASIAPPEMPVYVQPACPVDGYLWQPGYWAYDPNDGYYWVPGVWVAPPQPEYLWTPAYWGYEGGSYGFHAGYWGPHVGFYGGINYGFGYGGWGFGGGSWSGGHFRYNTAVVNVNRTVIHNTYIDRTVIKNTYVSNHTSFNGPGGVTAKPRPEEEAAMKDHHVPPTASQISHEHNASKDKAQFASVNHGHPTAAAMTKVGGRPLDPQGHVAKASTLGSNRTAAKRAPTTVSHPAPKAVSHSPAVSHARPAARTAAPAARPAAPANRPAPKVNRPAPTQRPAVKQPQARPQAHSAPKEAEPKEKHR